MVSEGSFDDPDPATTSTAHLVRSIPPLEELNPDTWDMFDIQCRAAMECDGTWEAIVGSYPTIKVLTARSWYRDLARW